MNTPPAHAPSAPSWPYCAHGANPADPVGCRGIHVPGHTACLAHLDATNRTTYLDGLSPGADIDHRGTLFTEQLLNALLQALQDPATGTPRLGSAWFAEAEFSGNPRFAEVEFSGEAWFHRTNFTGNAQFSDATFTERAWFNRATFSGEALFGDATFTSEAWFNRATFSGEAWFHRTNFTGNAVFSNATFFGDAQFSDTAFSGRALFDRASFSGDTRFGEAAFTDDAVFSDATFADGARFHLATFSGEAWFIETTFSSDAVFNRAIFSRDAKFGGATISGQALFGGTTFSGEAWFGQSLFSGEARFDGATFTDQALFDRATFTGDAVFRGVGFEVLSVFGPVVCGGKLGLAGAVFGAPVTLEIAARQVDCVRTRWESTATLRLRYATADLSHAVLSFPVAVTAHPAPFTTSLGAAVDESLLVGTKSRVRVISVRGVDAAHLVLTDTDLTDCLFSGAFHLDQLRLEGRCTFALAPTGLHRRHSIWPCWWTRRRTLAEEHHWRAQTASQPTPPLGQPPSLRNWRTGPHHPDPDLTPDPDDVAALYRQLRKAFEDGKNEPGAADFYYGEMEMRRHDRTSTPWSERGLLWGYWLLSGYGLRASRALAWLAAAMLCTIVFMMGLGLPDSSPKQVATGTVPADGGKVSLVVDKQDPQLTLPKDNRFTGERFDKAVQVVLNSVVFRSSGQDLTTWGTYMEMASRFTEPALLALAALAIRSRIKR